MRELHRVAGRWTGLLLALLGLSGSVLVFRDELERLARPGVAGSIEPRGRAERPLEEIAGGALSAYPGASLLAYQIPAREGAPHEVLVRDGSQRVLLVAADPYEARALGLLRGERRIWLAPVARAHFHLAAAVLAVPLAGLLLSGLVLRRRRRDTHTWLGRAVSLPLLMWALTGVLFHAARPAGNPAPRAGTGARASLDELAAAARRALPAGRLSYLQMPAAAGSAVTARVRLPGEWRQTGENDIHLDPATAAVLRVDLGRDAGWRGWYLRLAALHFGEFGGNASKWAWALLGLAPLALWLTGLRRQR